MNSVNAHTGWLWVKQGFTLFRTQSAEMLALFFAYMFLNIGLSFVPLIGPFLPLMLVPVFSVSFMQACREIDAGRPAYPNLILAGFRSPALPGLLALGTLNIAATALAAWVSYQADGGALREYILSLINPESKYVANSDVLIGMAVFCLVYLPALMAFWYAAPLLAWQRMSPAKALFYSFFAVQRAWRAFIFYGLLWVALRMILPGVIGVIVIEIFGSALFAALTILTVTILLTVAMYCSFYPTYTDIFGKPDEVDQPAA